ncbi:MAG: SPOR domain-containing protein [Prevotellaceae bacterium]|jgi:nucleoid DNA-binding protein/flagellar basal body-associated protein FliL|nr:SPOR domain-containing protein [Prevotellaceae bacterium]
MALSLFKISTVLVELLREHNRVSLPGIGAFKTEYKPAMLIKNGKSILPPSKTVEFREEEVWNDGLLEARVAQKEAILLDDAGQQIAQLSAEIQSALNDGKRVEFPDFGTLRITDDGDFLFEKDDDLNLLPASAGLDELSITPLPEAPAEAPAKPNPKPVPAKPPVRKSITEPSKNQVIESVIKPNVSPKKKEKQGMDNAKTNRYIIIIVAIILLAGAGFALYMMYDHYRSKPAIVQTMPEDEYPTQPEVETTPPPVAQAYTPAPDEGKKSLRQGSRKRHYYHVVLGAYADEATAETVMREQKSAGVCDGCQVIHSDGQYKISAYRYRTKSEATDMLNGFKRTDAEYLSAWVERF